jgi:mono/diheme cytochrome c family protein
MKVHSKALLVASLAVTVAACGNSSGSIAVPPSASGGSGTTVPVAPPKELPPVAGQDVNPSGSQGAQQLFVTKVYPLLTDINANTQNCGNCHSVGTLGAPGFLAGSPQNAYKVFRDYNGGALAAFPERNLLLLKSEHEGPQLDGEQRGAVVEWLQAEYPGRQTPDIQQSLFDSLDNFATCMNRDEFKGQQVDQIVNTQLSAIAGVTCDLCHSLAQAPLNGGSFVLDQDPDITFDNAKKFPGIMKFVTGVVGNTGVFQDLRESLRIIRKGNELNLQGVTQCVEEANEVALVQGGGVIDVDAAIYCHPNYNVDQDLEDKLHQFVSNTRSRARDQVCTDDNNPGGA